MDAIKATGQIPRRKRVHTFIGCCPLRLIFEDGNEGLIGRGSGGLLIRMAVTAGQKASMPVIEVGNFCEAAQCEIQIGGEHPNAKVFNNSLSGLPLLRGFLKNQGIATYQATHPKPTRIGHGVILSKSCLINTGAEIGTGSVIGSGAIVTRSAIPDWSVAAGNPARVVKQRISKEVQEIAEDLQWWNWDIEFFCRHVHLLLDAEKYYKDLAATREMADDRYRLVVEMEGSGSELAISVLGIDDNGKFVAIRDTRQEFQAYLAQMDAPEEQVLTWMPNPFRLL